MDPFTQGILGATAAALICRRNDRQAQLRLAALYGALAGMAPDLDIVIRDANDPMFGLGYHRHFTHSLLFVPFGSLLMAWIIRMLLRPAIPFKNIFFYCCAGMATHGLLDAMTNYGTHLFWPFSNRRESWSIISIIDPIFTLTLAILLGIALWKKTYKPLLLSAVFASAYWALGLYQKERVTTALMELAAERGHQVERVEVKPSFANLVAWRGQYLHRDMIYIDAYHSGFWKGIRVYEGAALPLYKIPNTLSATQQKDFEYFNFFSDGWLAQSPSDPGLIGDVRFAMLPHHPGPIWGIRTQDDPSAHVSFEHVRTRTDNDIMQLWAMIRGDDL